MHLSDYFIELIAYVIYFKKTVGVKQPNYEKVKADISRLLTQSEECLKNNLFSREDYDQARFMICAWIDEVILGSSWNHKSLWQREQLQRLYYNTTDAGEEVFERLNSIGLHQREVREVYYLCLALGFTGRYCHEGDAYLIDQLRTSNLKLLMGSSIELPSLERTELFPEAYPSETMEVESQKKKFRFSASIIICIAGPALFFGILLIMYWFVLGSIGNNTL